MIKLLKVLGFTPKENTTKIHQKKYHSYSIEIDLKQNTIDYGGKIVFNDTKNSVQNITKAEDWVVLECVDRLLEKEYKPENIILEKSWKTGHGTSGRVDILVTNEDDSSYMMIECKTWAKEFEKEFSNLQKNGGQLFTYFQQDKKAEILVLYTSKLDGKNVVYKNEIIKIEEEYRATSNVKDFYDRWNKLTKNNGVFESYASVYAFVSKALTKQELQVLKQEDSGFIFNRFLEILRHNVVSDKPNAFNKIFTLFLCKIIDEDRNDDEQLHFQWLEGEDTHISFQKRLSDLYTRGMKELLEKQVTDVSDSEFDKQFQQVDDEYRTKFKDMLTEIRLKKNNEFAIKEVYDDDSFNENAIVVKEIVELLQTYQIRYNYRQQFLSDFFELLLTTGLKQESGQFFTPVPLARFIIKSMPITQIVEQKVAKGDKTDLLPAIIDYAAGSGHFITESMEEVQKYIDTIDEHKLSPTSKRAIQKWKADPFDWAEDYIYAIERDYRLVKTAKVSCYLHGDGLAKVIHGDGLADFKAAKEYKDRLSITDKTYTQDNKQFDVVISNPPYSVSSFKSMMDSEKSKENFELFDRLTDQSSEIETLFIERTKQLLKDGGMAGIILPSSILSNTGIYTKTREIILNYFDIVSMVELGSNTFMATSTNTVILFLRRKNNADHLNIKASVEKLFSNKKDITINGVENPLEKYLIHVWEDVSLEEYFTLLDDIPSENVLVHEIVQGYIKKFKDVTSEYIVKIEKEKLLYFIMAYPQKVTVVKTGEKKEEKKFLGYEFSNRRGSEGIHPTQRGKTIDECTSLYDENAYNNSLKANAYIYAAFNGELKEIDESLQSNISYVNLVDMMTFDSVDFEKNISLNVKKKVNYEKVWKTDSLIEIYSIADIVKGKTITQKKAIKGSVPVIAGGQSPAYYHNEANRDKDIITVSASGAYAGFVNYFDIPIFASDCNTVKSKNEQIISTKLIYMFLKYLQPFIYDLQRGQAQPHVYKDDLVKIKIPLPSKEIQENIVKEIEEIDHKERKRIEELKEQKDNIIDVLNSLTSKKVSLGTISGFKNGLNYNKKSTGELVTLVGVGDFKNNFSPDIGQLQKVQIEGKLNDDYTLQSNDLLVVRSNGSANLVGRFLYIERLKEKISFSGFTIRIRPDKEQINSKFLCYYLKTDFVRDVLTKDSKGSNIKSLNQGLLSAIKVPLPSIQEQEKIILQIEAIEKKIAKKEKELEVIPQQKEDVLKKYL